MPTYYVLDLYDPPVVFRRNADGSFDVFDRSLGDWRSSPGLSKYVLDGACCADVISSDRATELIAEAA